MSVIDSMFPPDYFPKTNSIFIVGEEHNRLSGCNVLASLHIQPGQLHMASETSPFAYVSHSIKEFFSNLKKVPENFNNDDLAKEIIKNVTSSPYNLNHSLLYLGSYITEGYVGCPEIRFDWEQDGQMHNLSKVAGMSGTEKTKQWLGFNNTEGITKLSMVGTRASQFVDAARNSDQDAGATILSRYLPVQILFALFVAALVVSCA